jgi:8-amino-7-oxononanoate synthase
MSRFDDLFLETLATLERRGQRRRLVSVAPDTAGRSRLNGVALLNFSSNDYLGLTRHPLLAERAAAFTARFGAGAGASRLVCGTMDAHVMVETKLARWKGTDAALVLASGWQANVSVLSALLRLAGPDVLVFSDALNHSSLVHGCRAAGVRAIQFPHNDVDALAGLMAAQAGRKARRVIVTESVFSMDGDRADLARLRALARRMRVVRRAGGRSGHGHIQQGAWRFRRLCRRQPGNDRLVDQCMRRFCLYHRPATFRARHHGRGAGSGPRHGRGTGASCG